MADTGTLGTIASLVTAAGVTMLFFRIQREADMQRRGERTWIPVADWLLLGATITAIVVVLLPLLFFDSKLLGRRVPVAGCIAALVALGAYVFALLAHYRFILGSGRTGPRENPEPAERAIVIVAIAVSLMLFVVSLVTSS